ncbi:CPSF4 factor, partial [Eolophus roseicapillus]|nr:CPSF4 factor [Eolophus roseicapilla]
MQELVAGVEKIRFDLEADVEQQPGAHPCLSRLWPVSVGQELGAAVCTFFHQGLCTKGECWEGMGWDWHHPARSWTVVCKHWLRGLCTKGDGCGFLHECNQSRMPKCYFYSKFGECSNKDCPFLHVDASTTGCPWYYRGFCRQGELLGWVLGPAYVPYPLKQALLLCMAGPLCKYKHMRRVMCANYLVGFCPEGPNCRFIHSWQLLPHKLPQLPHSLQGAGCPLGLVQLDLAARKESGCKDVLPVEPPLPVTGAAQHPAVQPWDTSSCSLATQTLPEQGTGLKCRQKGHCTSNCGKTWLEILLGK